tara:strand:+ start:45 stop:1370 length:1326 start_codon:yes stop_codon:yes gene_type:complete
MPIVYKHQPSYAPVGAMALQTGQLQYRNQRRRELEEQQMRAAEMQQRERMANKQISANLYGQQMSHMGNMQKLAYQNQFQMNRDHLLNQYQTQSRADNFQNQLKLTDIHGQQQMDRMNQQFGNWKTQFGMQNEQNNLLQDQQRFNQIEAQNWGYIESRLNPQALQQWNQHKGQLVKVWNSDKLDEQQKQNEIGNIKQQMQDMYEGPNAAAHLQSDRFMPGYTEEQGPMTYRVGEDGVRRSYIRMENKDSSKPNYQSEQEAVDDWFEPREFVLPNGHKIIERAVHQKLPDGSSVVTWQPIFTPGDQMDADRIKLDTQKAARDVSNNNSDIRRQERKDSQATQIDLMNSYEKMAGAGLLEKPDGSTMLLDEFLDTYGSESVHGGSSMLINKDEPPGSYSNPYRVSLSKIHAEGVIPPHLKEGVYFIDEDSGNKMQWAANNLAQ